MDNSWLDACTWESEPAGPGKTPDPAKLTVLAQMSLIAAMTGVLVALLVVPALLPAAALTRASARYLSALPTSIAEPPLPQKSVLLDRNGHRFATLFAYDRTPVSAAQMSPAIRHTTIAVEDARFYQHGGFDPIGIVRAGLADARGGGHQGASTISQQYIKNVLVLAHELGSQNEDAKTGNAVSVSRKIREIKLASSLEAKYTKDQILTKYLNIAFFGNGAYGIEAAAHRYFSVPAKDLTALQSATLVPLLKNPTAYDPLKHPEVAKRRRAIALDRMVAAGYLTAAQADQLTTKPLGLDPSTPKSGCLYSKYPFYCAQVLKLLKTDKAFGATAEARAKLLEVGGLRIQTPLDPAAMKSATAAAKSTIPTKDPVATALSVIRPGTGEVVAIATNRNYGIAGPGDTEIVLPTISEFQPGSTFKLFTLAAAFDQGLPMDMHLPGGSSYTSKVLNNPPKGYFSNEAGSLINPSLTQATDLSMNTAFVQLEEKVGVRNIAEMANRLGVKSIHYQGPKAPKSVDGSYTLGTASVSTTEMADAYATAAAGGIYCPPKFITAIHDAAGNKVPIPGGACTRVLDQAAADTITHILSTVMTAGTGIPAYFGRPEAGKTGTTENYGAAWFDGYTPQYATAVWVGDPRGGAAHPLYNVLGYAKVFGGSLPGTVWRKTMTAIHQGLPVLQLPAADPSYVTTTAGQLLPSVLGLSQAAATNRIAVAGARVTAIKHAAAGPGQPAGVVVGQHPAAGTRAPGHAVTLTLTR